MTFRVYLESGPMEYVDLEEDVGEFHGKVRRADTHGLRFIRSRLVGGKLIDLSVRHILIVELPSDYETYPDDPQVF